MTGRTFSRWLDHIIVAKHLRRFFQNPRRILRDYVKPGMTVLDVGAGEGFFSIGMAKMVGPGGRVVSVDLDAEEIEHLCERAVEKGVSERIDKRVGSESSLQIDDYTGQVDFALAYYVVHHAPDVDALMSEVHKALKSGGKFLVVEPGHHASPDECKTTEARAQQSGFSLVDHPKVLRDWAALFAKE